MHADRFESLRSRAAVVALALPLWLVACGGGGGADSGAGTPPPAAAPAPAAPMPLSLPAPAEGSGTLVALSSSAGDRLGGGGRTTYTLANAGIGVVAEGSTLVLRLRGDEFWEARIRTSASGSTVVTGQHSGLRSNPSGVEPWVGMHWQREADSCDTADAMLSVDRVRYVDGVLAEVDLRIAQRCVGDSGMLQAQLRWVAGEVPVRAAAPPVPATLWRPAAGTVPARGNVVVVESSGDEGVFRGRNRVFTEDDVLMQVNVAPDRVEMIMDGGDLWRARLRGIERPEGLQSGFYDGLRGVVRGYNPARGALEWDRSLNDCVAPRGWFALDRLELERGALVAIEFRFEQRCLGLNGVFRGLVRWEARARRLPPAPGPAPAGAWVPAAGSVPGEGNHLLLTGPDTTRLLTDANAGFRVFDDAGVLVYSVTDPVGGGSWRGEFRGRGTAGRVEAGYRAPLNRFWNPAIGGLMVTGTSGGCTEDLVGWFVVDAVSHRHGVLRHVALRFEFLCEGSSTPQRGSLRWTSDDPSLWDGPADPPLPEPTIAPAPVMPASGSAALFESRGREYLGFGQDWLYTRDNAVVSVQRAAAGSSLEFSVRGDEFWRGFIAPPPGQERLQLGRHVLDGELPPAARGHLFDLAVDSRGCTRKRGWIEILALAYSGDEPSLIEFRFELYCDHITYPLLGHFRWRAGDAPALPVQVQPMPDGLWSPPAGALPTGGHAMYVQSNPGGWIGEGQTFLMQPAPGDAILHQAGDHLRFSFGTPEWSTFAISIHLPAGAPRLQPGFYAGTTSLAHPLRLEVELSGKGRACRRAEGWLAVDDVAYDELGLVRIALRLQQFCDIGPPAMAALRWSRPPP